MELPRYLPIAIDHLPKRLGKTLHQVPCFPPTLLSCSSYLLRAL